MVRPFVARDYEPDEARNPHGEWTTGGPHERPDKYGMGVTEHSVRVAPPTGQRGLREHLNNWHGIPTADIGRSPRELHDEMHTRAADGDYWPMSNYGTDKAHYHAAPEPTGRVAARPITSDEARDGSRAVSSDEFADLAAEGVAHLDAMEHSATPIDALDRDWRTVGERAWAETRKSWGGATIDPHTAELLPDGADKYALTVKPPGMRAESVAEDAGRQAFDRALDAARNRFRPLLEHEGHYLGIFHDDENHRIDIDPVVVVDNPHDVEAIGAATHAIGGAYHFATGNGYFPPHVADIVSDAQEAAADKATAAAGAQRYQPPASGTYQFEGPGQWRSWADDLQSGQQPPEDES